MAISHTDDQLVVAGEAESGEEALHMAQTLRPDIAVLDCRLPDMHGATAARWLGELKIPLRILALSGYEDAQYVYDMLQAGAHGYALKKESLNAIVQAIQTVAQGQEWYSREVMGYALAWARGQAPQYPGGLTSREAEVLRLVGRGWDNEQIAQTLYVSVGTVKNHLVSIYARLQIKSRAQAVAWAWKHKLVSHIDLL